MLNEKELSYIAMSHIHNTSYMADVETHELIFINESIQTILDDFTGNTGTSYVGKKCHKVLAGLDEPCSFCKMNCLIKGEVYNWENCNPLLNWWYALSDTLIEIDGRTVMLEIATDINSSKMKLLKLETQLTVDETLVRCAKTLSENQDMGIAIHSLLDTIGEFYIAERVIIFEINDTNHISNSYEWTKDGIESEKEKLQNLEISKFKGLIEQITHKNELYINAAQNDAIFNSDDYSSLGLAGLEHLMGVPLKIDEKLIGFLAVNNAKVNCNNMNLLRSVSLFVANDLHKLKNLEDFKRLASIDVFTGLYNRNKYIETINQIIANKLDTVGIVYLDINGLKQANDKYGHEHGDEIIQKAVSLINVCFSGNVFRIGGDEFVILYIDNNREKFDKSVLLLRSLLNNQSDVSISIGSVWCTETTDISNQITHANELMYIGKHNYYDNLKMNGKKYQVSQAINLQNELANGEFVVFLQPKLRLSDEQIIGAEALVRKKDGQGGLIPPDKFIEIYEADGIISYLDFAVLEKACMLLKEWKESNCALIPISVNFSRITILEHKVADKINAICQKHGVDSHYIVIELTEHISNISLSCLNEIVTSIKSYGFKISLDDFGREYSNLAILTNIAFDEIKLDKSLIDNISTNPAIGSMIDYAAKMCNAFRHTEIVIEGIETQDQLRILRNLNCDLNTGQGFYFSRPLSIDDFMKYFNSKQLKSE